MFSIEGDPAIACTNNEITDALDAAWLTKSEGNIARIAVFPAVGLTCDVTFGE